MSISDLFNQSLQAHQAGDLVTARRGYESVLIQDPKHADALHLLGMLWAQQGQYQDAVQFIERALALQPDNALYHNNLGNAYRGLDQFDEAQAHYLKAIALNPDYAEAHNNLGAVYYLKRQLDLALKHYHHAVRLKPDYAAAHLNIGTLFLMQEKIDEALMQFQNVLQLNPNSLQARYQVANLLLQKNDLAGAKAQYQSILDELPEHLDCLNNMGVIALKENQPQLAIEYFTKVLSLDDAHLDARNNIAATFIRYNRYENAISHYELYLELKPDDVEAHYNLAVAYMCLGELAQAKAHFLAAVKHYPDHVDAYTNLGAIALRENDRRTAKHYFEKALALDSENAIVQHMLAAIDGQAGAKQAPNEYIKNLFDNYALQYDQHLQKTLHYRLPKHIADALIPRLHEQKVSILDLGCGTGLSGVPMKPHASSLVGVDLSEAMLEQAGRKAIYDELHHQSIQAFLENDARKFDVILASDALGYIGDLSEIFEAVPARLSESGLFCFTVEQAQAGDFHLQETIRYAYSSEYLHRLAKDASLSIIQEALVQARTQDNQPLNCLLLVLKKDGAKPS